jgi:hypothetical protein
MDSEFCLCFDFGNRCIEIESMLMASVVGVGVRLVQCEDGIIIPSTIVRNDRITLRLDSSAFHQAIVLVNGVPYTYMRMGLNTAEDAICLYTYNSLHVLLSEAVVQTLNLEDQDTDFIVVAQQEDLAYEVQIEHVGATWKTYLQACTGDTVIRYTNKTQTLTWEISHQQTKVSLYLPVTVVSPTDVNVCLLPAVVNVLRNVLQITTKFTTSLSIGVDLPVRLFAPLDTHGSFIRVYAGTKDDN